MRRLALELDLDAGSFTARMRQAGRETEVFQRRVDTTTRTLQRMDRGINGTSAKLRDFVLVMGNLREAIENTRFFFTGLIEAAVGATAEIERTIFLLRGLSNASTEFGKRKEAQQNLEALIETAKAAPFSIQALSDTFVKFKAGGIDPTTGGMNALIDSVAAFGGSDEILKRAAIAIQQMGGKGVISMEELRQQLGEAVPTAINLMAKGLGKSYGVLVKEISTGTVRAKPALDAMFKQMELVYGGSAARMMGTFQGRVAQLKTSLVELAMAFTGMDTAGNVKDGSLYDGLKDTIQSLTETFNSGGFRQGMADFGSAIANITQAIFTLSGLAGDIAGMIPPFLSVKETVLLLATALISVLVGKGVKALGEAMGKVRQSLGSTTTAMRVQRAETMQSAAANRMAAQATLDRARMEASAHQDKLNRLRAEKAQLQAVQIEERRRLAAAIQTNNTGRTPDGKFASAGTAEVARVTAMNNLQAAGARLSVINTQLTATETALAGAHVRAAAAANAETLAHNGSLMAKMRLLGINGIFFTSIAALQRMMLAASTGARTFALSIMGLSTAQGRAALTASVMAAGTRVLGAASIAASVAVRGLSVALGFFGGPIGIAIMAVAGAMMAVSAASREAAQTTENAKNVFAESSQTLHRLAEGGIIAASETTNMGKAAGGAADALRQVGRDAMQSASNLHEYAAAARTATIAELNLQAAKVGGAIAEARGNTSAGARANMQNADRLRTAADGGRSIRDIFNSMGAYGRVLSLQGRNFIDGGASEKAMQDTIARGTTQLNEINRAIRETRASGDDAWKADFDARGNLLDTGDADIKSGGKGGGKKGGRGGGQSPDEKGTGQAIDMLARVRGIEAEMAGAGKEAAKLQFLLNTDPEMKKISGEIKENMMAAATALDVANERMKGFQAFTSLTEEAEKQEETARRLREEIDLTVAGQSALVVESAKYRAGLSDDVKTAGKFTTEAEAMADKAAKAQREVTKLAAALQAVNDLQEAVKSSALAAGYAWEDFTSGASETNRELNRVRRTYAEILAKIEQGTPAWAKAKADMEAAIDNTKMEQAARKMIEMRDNTRRIMAETSGVGMNRERNVFEKEAADYEAYVVQLAAGTQRRQQAEAAYYAWRQAKEREMLFNSPIGQMAQEWGDMWGNLQELSSQAMGSFIDDLMDGKKSFSEFTASLLKDIAKIIIRALIAKAIMAAMNMIAPGSGNVAGSMGGGSFGMNMGTGSMNYSSGFDWTGMAAFHGGGIAGGKPTFTRTVPVASFDAVPKFHGGGIVGGLKSNEVNTVLKKKEGVFTEEQMAALAPVGSGTTMAMPNVQVNVINESGQAMDAQQSGSRFDGKNFILDVVIDAASKPGKMREALKGVTAR